MSATLSRETSPQVTQEHQAFATVLRAELRRLFSRGGGRGAAVISLAIALAAGSLTMLTFEVFSEGEDLGPLGVTLPVEVLATTFAIAFGIACTSTVARDSTRGVMPMALVVAPHRGRLFGARLVVWSVAGACAVLAGGAVLGVAGALIARPAPDVAGVLLVCILISAVAVAFFTALAFSVATIIASPIVAVLAYVGLAVIAPIALLVAQLAIAPLAGAFTAVLSAMPAVVFAQAVGTSGISETGVAPLVAAHLALLMWAAVAATVAAALFRRRDY